MNGWSTLQHVARRADRDHVFFGQHRDARRQREQRVEVVRDHHHRQAQLAVQRLDQRDEGVRQVGIEAGGRLVQEQQLRFQRQRARQRRALDHAARQVGRHLVGVLRRPGPPCPFSAAPRRGSRLRAARAVRASAGRCCRTPSAPNTARPAGTACPSGCACAAAAAASASLMSSPNTCTSRAPGVSRPSIWRSSTVLPVPEPPTMRQDLARVDLEVQVLVHHGVAELGPQAVGSRPPAGRRLRRASCSGAAARRSALVVVHQNPTPLKMMANTASARITTVIAVTTEVVVPRPEAFGIRLDAQAEVAGHQRDQDAEGRALAAGRWCSSPAAPRPAASG